MFGQKLLLFTIIIILHDHLWWHFFFNIFIFHQLWEKIGLTTPCPGSRFQSLFKEQPKIVGYGPSLFVLHNNHN